MRCLLSLAGDFFCRVGVCFHLAAKHRPVGRTSVLFPRKLCSFVIYPLLGLVRHVRFSSLLRLLIRPTSLVVVGLGCLFLCRAIRGKEQRVNTLRRFFLKSFFQSFVSRGPQAFRVFRRRYRLLQNAQRSVGRCVRPFFVHQAHGPRPHLHLKFVDAPRLLLCGGHFFVRRQLSSDRGVFCPTLLLRLDSALLYVRNGRVRGTLFAFQR